MLADANGRKKMVSFTLRMPEYVVEELALLASQSGDTSSTLARRGIYAEMTATRKRLQQEA